MKQNLKKILFIADAYHKKTKSCDFLTDYLSEFYEVEVMYCEAQEIKHGFDYTKISNEYYCVIFWQNAPRKKVFKKIKHPNVVFFPMYDAVKDWKFRFGKWSTFKNTKIVCFSSTLHKKLKKWGFNSLYVQYFIKPQEFEAGAADEIFFWQRRTKDNFDMLKKLLGDFDAKVHLHGAVDPDETLQEPSDSDKEKYQVTFSNWFDSKEEMNQLIKQKAIYVAPRRYEGIGMSFLEAMAMGRVVIANNKPTMNEYIKNGVTGFLCDFAHPKKLKLENIEQIQKNTYEYAKKGYEKWLEDRKNILSFIELKPEEKGINKLLSNSKIKSVSIYDIDCEEELIYPEEKFLMPAQDDVLGCAHECFKESSSIIKPFYVRSIKNGICKTNQEEIYISENEVVEELTSQESNPQVGKWKLCRKKIKRVSGKVAHLSLSGLEDNYYHWLVECLGRLNLIEQSGFEPDYYIVSQNSKFKREYLELLGIDKDKIIAAESNQLIQADEIIVADFINNWELIDFRGCVHYQKKYLPSWIGNLYKERILPSFEKSPYQRIYVSRKNANYRKVLNSEEILEILEKYDFKVIYPEDLSIREQIILFYGADIVVSPMGAGLGNTLFCENGTKILEICPQYFHTSCLRILAHVLGLKYNYFVGKTEDTSMHPQKEDMLIDPEEFEKALKEVLK